MVFLTSLCFAEKHSSSCFWQDSKLIIFSLKSSSWRLLITLSEKKSQSHFLWFTETKAVETHFQTHFPLSHANWWQRCQVRWLRGKQLHGTKTPSSSVLTLRKQNHINHRQPKDWEKTFTHDATNKELISNIQQFYSSITKIQTTQSTNGQKA